MRPSAWLAALVEGLAGAAVGLALAVVLVVAAAQIRPSPAPLGTRHEPPPVVGARVLTEHGPGVITAQIAMADGPAWQVRLEDGRHVVLYRAQMVVLRDE